MLTSIRPARSRRLPALPLLLAPLGCAAPADSVDDLRVETGVEALEILMEGNRRFVEDEPVHLHQSRSRRARLAEGQDPIAIVLGCADSRVSPELLFDTGLGDIFVVRVAGNLPGEDEVGSIEYAVEHLHTPLVLVLGHEGCGAITAAIEHSEDELPELHQMLNALEFVKEGIDEDLPLEERVAHGVEMNVRRTVAHLQELHENHEGGEHGPVDTLFQGGVYELATGRVRLLE